MKSIFSSLVLIFLAIGTCSAQSTLVYFPQFVDGRTAGSTAAWGSVLLVTNPAAPGTSTATVSITLTSDTGSPMNIPFTDITGTPVANTAFGLTQFQIAGGQTEYLVSQSNTHYVTPLNSGFAQVTSDRPVTAALIFIEYSCVATDGCGSPISEAGVSATVPLTGQAVPIMQNSSPGPGNFGLDGAVAVANPGSGTVHITFQLLDTSGNQLLDSSGNAIGPVQQTLAALNHTAFFIPQLFPSAPALFGGTLRITSDSPIVTTGLSFMGPGLFATIPVFSLPGQ